MITKLGYAINWGATDSLPRPKGVSSVVFVPNNLEEHKPYPRMGEVCMAFLTYFEPYFESTKYTLEPRRFFNDGDWMFWFAPFSKNNDGAVAFKYKKTHLAYLEHILGPDCTTLKSLERPDSWSLIKNSITGVSSIVFVHNDLDFYSRDFFCVNTFIRALWEYPSYVDNWVHLVNNGVDKDEALYFMWVTESEDEDGSYKYSFTSTNHSPLNSSINFENFLKGEPKNTANSIFSEDGWETGIQTMWGSSDNLTTLLGLTKSGRFGYGADKDLLTLIKGRQRHCADISEL